MLRKRGFLTLLTFTVISGARCTPLTHDSDQNLVSLACSLELLATSPEIEKEPSLWEHRDPRCLYIENKIHELINAERAKYALNPLAWNAQLAQAARNHSNDMAARNYMDHFSPEGHDFLWRYKQVGFTDYVRIGNKRHLGAENIFKIEKKNIPIEPDRDAKQIVAGWMQSPGHRKNILEAYWMREGIGITIVETGKKIRIYATENFC